MPKAIAVIRKNGHSFLVHRSPWRIKQEATCKKCDLTVRIDSKQKWAAQRGSPVSNNGPKTDYYIDDVPTCEEQKTEFVVEE